MAHFNGGNGSEPPVYIPDMSENLKIIPVSGLGAYGKNLMVYEYGPDIIIVDCGLMFPRAGMMGIDFVIPNSKYLEQNKDRIRGILITHGHEDHIGGLPYVLPRIGSPTVYATKLTRGLIEVKIEEFKIDKPKLETIKPGDKLRLGAFEVEAFRVNHSIPDCVGFAIRTPDNLVIHTGDYKIDHTPVDEEIIDFGKLSQYAQEGVLALVADSTNVEVEGYTPSEKVIGETFKNLFHAAKARVILATFASQINRIQQVIDAADDTGRKVLVTGRSMEKNIEVATRLGYLKIKPSTFVTVRDAKNMPDSRIAVLSTGSQGEGNSALARMASGEHQIIQIKKGDTVIISASQIPGNESSVSGIINNLFKLGANVIYGHKVDVHVSGHAAKEEMKMMIDVLRPRYVFPAHGEDRHLVLHGRLAESVGYLPENTIIAEDGMVFEFDKTGKYKLAPKRVPSGYVMVDGSGIGDVGNIVLRDRQAMSQDGIFVIIATVNHVTGELVTSPDLISRGFIYMRAHEELVHKTRAEVKRLFKMYNDQHRADWDLIKTKIRDDIGGFLYSHTRRRPMIIPVVIEV